jgi:hypothetical protein
MIFEFRSVISELTGLEIFSGSVYEGIPASIRLSLPIWTCKNTPESV